MDEEIIIIEEEGEQEIGLEEEGEETVDLEDEEQELEVEIEEENEVFNLDYNNLINKPAVNGVELIHNKDFEELGVKPMTNMEILGVFNRVFGEE